MDDVARSMQEAIPGPSGLCGSGHPATAQEATAPAEPQPDPAGIATGDKSSAVDAGGNSFVVAAPTDTKAPDYAAKKQAFDEYQALVSLPVYQKGFPSGAPYLTPADGGDIAALIQAEGNKASIP